MGLILIVEDDAQVRQIMVDILNDEHLIVEAQTGERALQLLKLARPNLVILDINLNTGLSGIDVCHAIRQTPALYGVPILAISGRADRFKVSDILAVGANTFLAKPYTPVQLQNKVKQMLEIDAVSIAGLLAALGEYKLIDAVKLAIKQGHSLMIIRALKYAIADVQRELYNEASDG